MAHVYVGKGTQQKYITMVHSKGTWQGYMTRGARVQGCKGARVQGYYCARVQGCKSTQVYGSKGVRVQGCKSAIVTVQL